MTELQWSEIEATIKYMIGRPADVERMLPHLRRIVERMPKRCSWWGWITPKPPPHPSLW